MVMKLSQAEEGFLTAVVREQNQNGCRGPAHDLLREHAYPDAPRAGSGSLAFSYEIVPLIGILLRDVKDLQALDDFIRVEQRDSDLQWPWASAGDYRIRLEEAERSLQLTEKTQVAKTS